MSLVFFDLETSGLPSAANPARITEISMMAVSINGVKNLAADRANTSRASSAPPRIISRITLAVDPQKPLPRQVEGLTGLSNSILSEHPPFCRTTASLIDQFLSLLPQPPFLIAHNGLRFDLTLLRAELLRVDPDCLKHAIAADSLSYFVDKWKRSCVSGPRPSFSLANLYRRQFGSELSGAHCSDTDTAALAKLCLAEGHSFLDWLKNNAKPFYSIKPMWTKP